MRHREAISHAAEEGGDGGANGHDPECGQERKRLRGGAFTGGGDAQIWCASVPTRMWRGGRAAAQAKRAACGDGEACCLPALHPHIRADSAEQQKAGGDLAGLGNGADCIRTRCRDIVHSQASEGDCGRGPRDLAEKVLLPSTILARSVDIMS